jgi:hypothetical protein
VLESISRDWYDLKIFVPSQIAFFIKLKTVELQICEKCPLIEGWRRANLRPRYGITRFFAARGVILTPCVFIFAKAMESFFDFIHFL